MTTHNTRKSSQTADMQTADILISGGGVPGLTLALLLGRLGARVAVIEPVPPGKQAPAAETRTSALMTGSINILKAAGVWERCAPLGSPMTGLSIVDDSTGHAETLRVDFRAEEIGQEIFSVNMPNDVLRTALMAEAAAVPTITIYAPARLRGFTADAFGVTADIDGAPRLRAPLLVGADGRRSQVRTAAGIAVTERDYDQKAMTCLIDHTRPHENISTEFHRPSGPFTLVPLPGNRSSIVWVDTRAAAETFLRLDKTAFTQALQERSRDLRGTITLAVPPQGWDLQSLVAARLTAPRVALVAEAAHVLHPLGAQGLNLSLRDVAALAETVADALRLGQDPGSRAVLGQYEQNRRHDIRSRTAGTDMLNRMVSSNLLPVRELRRAGLRAVSHIAPLRGLAIREGLAPALHGNSRLASGQPL